MSVARYLIGDTFDVVRTLPDDSVDLILTSPPFLALRSYLPADHPDKAKEIGSEPTPAEFLDTLLALTAEWERVLAPHGSIAVELGDTYSGSTSTGGPPMLGDPAHPKRWDRDTASDQVRKGAGWPLDKSLCGIPHLYHLSLAYGRNLLTGEPSPAGQWRVRNVVAWCRPNPPVGALGDKFRPATSYMTVACKARDRWFDLDAVRNPDSDKKPGGSASRQPVAGEDQTTDRQGLQRAAKAPQPNPAGAPPLDWWQVSTEPYSGSHYATWPRKLLDRPIRAMCPIQVCVECGEPRRRIDGGTEGGITAVRLEGGWSDCGHDTWRNGIVLDPFAGSGTTLAVATGHGRDAIGIDLDERNAHLAQERIGMFLDITDTRSLPKQATSKEQA